MIDEMRKASIEQAIVRQKEKADKMIWVTFKKEGIHKYPAALEDPKLKTGGWDDVSLLGYPHRHIFHFRVWIEVFHDDRSNSSSSKDGSKDSTQEQEPIQHQVLEEVRSRAQPTVKCLF